MGTGEGKTRLNFGEHKEAEASCILQIMKLILELVLEVKGRRSAFLSEIERQEHFLSEDKCKVSLPGADGLCGDAERTLSSLVLTPTLQFKAKTPLNLYEFTCTSLFLTSLFFYIHHCFYFNTSLFYFLPISAFKCAPMVLPCSECTAVTKMHISYQGPSVWKKNMGQHNSMIFPSVNILWLNKVLLQGTLRQAASHTPLSCLINHVLILLTLVLPIFQLYDMH